MINFSRLIVVKDFFGKLLNCFWMFVFNKNEIIKIIYFNFECLCLIVLVKSM